MQRCIELLDKLQASGEISTAKLGALQKVLQSDFLNAVREVYEHVYETVDIQGSQDVRASATAKATVAAFAASEGHGKFSYSKTLLLSPSAMKMFLFICNLFDSLKHTQESLNYRKRTRALDSM